MEEEKCANKDYSHRFGPYRDQGSLAYCWSFVATQLAEEQRCLENKDFCGKALSVTDAASCESDFSAVYESSLDRILNAEDFYSGNTISNALSCISKQGICEESLAPYHWIDSRTNCSWKKFLWSETCVSLSRLEKAYNNVCREESCSTCVHPVKTVENEAAIQFLETYLAKTLPDDFAQSTTAEKALISSSTWDKFLKKILVPQRCEENRKKPLVAKTIFTELYPQNYPDIIKKYYPDKGESLVAKDAQTIAEKMIARLKRGSSIGIGVCLEDLSITYKIETIIKAYTSFGTLTDDVTCNSRHALIVNGSRWNKKTNTCEVQLRNSWGEGADFNGWYDIDIVADATFLVDQIQ